MLEFVAFGSIVTGVLYAQHRFHDKNSTRHYIEKVFRNTGIAIGDRNKEGQTTKVKFPTYIGKRPIEDKQKKQVGISYIYRLPVGLSYRMLTETKPLDIILEDMFNRDVLIKDEKNNTISINIYANRLPKKINYDLEWLKLNKNYKVVIGVDHHGLIFHDFNDTPHMIIGGMTKYGKSVIMKLIITQLIFKHRLGLRFHLFDLKGGLAFNRFKKLPQVYSVAIDEVQSLNNLKKLRNGIKKRMMYFAEKGYENIGEAWKAGETINREVIIIDEASVLAPQTKSDQLRHECRTILEFIAQVSGQLGYNLIICSQYPTGDILPRQVKQNSDARISFRLPTSTASNVILDESGAEEIEFGMRGRAIYKADQKKMIQVPYMSNEMIDELLEPYKQEGIVYDHEPTEEDREGASNTENVEAPGLCHEITVANYTPFGSES